MFLSNILQELIGVNNLLIVPPINLTNHDLNPIMFHFFNTLKKINLNLLLENLDHMV